jgi:hypothetical protein
MVKKWKQAKGTAQEVGSPGKHLQFRKDRPAIQETAQGAALTL